MSSNETIQTIMSRRSIRSFTDDSISREDMETIVECARWAPSAMNRQEWCFVVVQDRRAIADLADVVKIALSRDSYDMYRPAAIIIVGHKSDADWGSEDDGCAMQTIFLAAASLGIGSCWINQLQGLCDVPSVREKLTGLGLPSNYSVHGIAALGYAAADGKALARKSTVMWA